MINDVSVFRVFLDISACADLRWSCSDTAGTYDYAPFYEFVWNGVTCSKKSAIYSSKKPVVVTQVMLIDRFYEPNEYKRAKRIFNIVGWSMVGMELSGVIVGIVVILLFFDR